MSAKKKESKKTCKDKLYTTGQTNRLIDDLIHPFYSKNEWLRILDGIAHGIVEGDVEVSAKKFAIYNMPAIKRFLEELMG